MTANMIGTIFPIKGENGAESIPWGIVEPHRAAIVSKFGKTPERLFALGGLNASELVSILTGKDTSAADARKFLVMAGWIKEQKD